MSVLSLSAISDRRRKKCRFEFKPVRSSPLQKRRIINLSTRLLDLYFKIPFVVIAIIAIASNEAASQTRVKVVYSTITPPSAPLWIAKDKGFFQREGLSVDLVYVESGPRSVQALVSGDTLVTASAGVAVANAKIAGADVVMIADLVNVFPFFLATRSDIASPSDLKGKIGATQVFGSGGDLALRMGLRSLGLDPNKDVQLRVIGASNVRVQALENGLVDFALLEPMLMFQAKRSNLKILVDFTEKGIAYQHIGIITLASSLKQNRLPLLAFLKGVLKGIAFYKRNKHETVAIISKYSRLHDLAVLDSSYEWFRKIFPDTPYPTVEGFKTIFNMIAENRKGVASVDPKSLVDRTLLDELAANGFLRSLVPESGS